MAEPTLTRAEFAQSIKAKYPAYATLSDEEVATKMLATYPQYEAQIKKDAPSTDAPMSMADRAKAALDKSASPQATTAAALTAVPAMRAGAEQLATSPQAWKTGKVIGELLGLIEGGLKGGPIGAAGGMWVGGKAGWRLTNAAQRLAAPVSKILSTLEPFAAPMSALSAEGDALTSLNNPDELTRISHILGLPKTK